MATQINPNQLISRFQLYMTLSSQFPPGANPFIIDKDGREYYRIGADLVRFYCCGKRDHKLEMTPLEMLDLQRKYGHGTNMCPICRAIYGENKVSEKIDGLEGHVEPVENWDYIMDMTKSEDEAENDKKLQRLQNKIDGYRKESLANSDDEGELALSFSAEEYIKAHPESKFKSIEEMGFRGNNKGNNNRQNISRPNMVDSQAKTHKTSRLSVSGKKDLLQEAMSANLFDSSLDKPEAHVEAVNAAQEEFNQVQSASMQNNNVQQQQTQQANSILPPSVAAMMASQGFDVNPSNQVQQSQSVQTQQMSAESAVPSQEQSLPPEIAAMMASQGFGVNGQTPKRTGPIIKEGYVEDSVLESVAQSHNMDNGISIPDNIANSLNNSSNFIQRQFESMQEAIKAEQIAETPKPQTVNQNLNNILLSESKDNSIGTEGMKINSDNKIGTKVSNVSKIKTENGGIKWQTRRV